MKLTLSDGDVWHLHTIHVTTWNPMQSRMTKMALHRGACTTQRPCAAPAFTSRATCHENDQYVRIAGNKIAFGRLVASFPRHQRAELWKAFWDNHKKPRG